jgi:hypothetical protein
LLEACPAHIDKVEIKCMVSIGGKTPTEPKFYSFSLALSTLNRIRLILCALFILMGDEIRRMRVNVSFEYIWQKEWNCLIYGRIVQLYIM